MPLEWPQKTSKRNRDIDRLEKRTDTIQTTTLLRLITIFEDLKRFDDTKTPKKTGMKKYHRENINIQLISVNSLL